MEPNFDKFFDNYAAAFNRSLGDEVDTDAIMASFAECFISAGPTGVNCGQNGPHFREVLQGGYKFYKDVGTERMAVHGVDVTTIDPNHHMAIVHWRAHYTRKDGSPVSIDFDVAYLLQTLRNDTPKIFAYVAGDEMAALEKHGLIEVKRKP
jgi:hypothetical protein